MSTTADHILSFSLEQINQPTFRADLAQRLHSDGYFLMLPYAVQFADALMAEANGTPMTPEMREFTDKMRAMVTARQVLNEKMFIKWQFDEKLRVLREKTEQFSKAIAMQRERLKVVNAEIPPILNQYHDCVGLKFDTFNAEALAQPFMRINALQSVAKHIEGIVIPTLEKQRQEAEESIGRILAEASPATA